MEEREERLRRLKRLKQKRMISMVVLLVVILGLGGAYVAVNRQNEKKAAEEAKKKEEKELVTNQTVQITEFSLTDVAEIEFTNEEASYHFVWTKVGNYGSWVRQGVDVFPTNDEKVQIIGDEFCQMTGTMRIPAEEVVLSDYGLDKVTYSAKLTLTDGEEHRFSLGDETPYSEGYYMLYENTGDVFVVRKTVHTQLSTKELKLVLGETFPSAEPKSMMEIRIEVRDGETISYKPEVAEDGTMTFPQIFYDSIQFVASTIQEYNCTDFAQYGLDDPYVTVTVDYLGYVMDEEGAITREPMTMVAEIGDKTVSDNYFVRINGSDFVYIMAAAHAKKYIPQ